MMIIRPFRALTQVLFALATSGLMPRVAGAQCPTPTREQFGYNTRPTRGTRPLVTVLVDFTDADLNPNRDSAYYERTLFSGEQSVNAMYRAASNNGFQFTNAGIVRVAWTGAPAGLPPDYDAQITAMTAAAMRAAGRPMESFDRNGDRIINNSELIVLRITNSPVYRGGAQTRGHRADLGGGFAFDGQTSNSDEVMDVNTLAHELMHSLGSPDHIYGPRASLNQRASFMAASYRVLLSPGPIGLDPYERIRRGWVIPRIVSDQTSGMEALERYGAGGSVLLFYNPTRCTREFFLAEHRWPARTPVAAGDFGGGLVLWYVRPTTASDFTPFQFNWPPPILGPYVGSAGNHAIANYVAGPGGPGVSTAIAASDPEFLPTWGDGTRAGFGIEMALPSYGDTAYVGWRKVPGKFVATIDRINGVTTGATIRASVPDTVRLEGDFPVRTSGITVELIDLSGRTRLSMTAYRPDRIVVVTPGSLRPGRYHVRLFGREPRDVITRGRTLLTVR